MRPISPSGGSMSIGKLARGCAPALLLVSMTLCANACAVATSQPLYDAKHDLVFDRCLLGTWLPEYPLKLARGPDKAYRVAGVWTTGDASKSGPPLTAHLVPIGKYRYLFFADWEDGREKWTGTLLFPCFRVEVHRRKLILRMLSVVKIGRDLEEHPHTLSYRQVFPATQAADPAATEPSTRSSQPPASRSATQPDTQPAGLGIIVLTDSPQRIRAYLIRHQDDPDFVGDPITFRRVRR
jgi:hypothetical protein